MATLPEQSTENEKNLRWFFDLALWLKIVNGGVEILAGILVLAVPHSLVLRLADYATDGELAQDANDVVANSIQSMAHTFAVHTHYLLALYLVLHGAIKVLLVIGIFMGKKIAYPLFMVALILFGSYETYRGFVLHETLLQILALFDIMLLVLTMHDYRQRYPREA